MSLAKLKLWVVLLVFCVAVPVFGATDAGRDGDWVIKRSDAPGKIYFSLIESHSGGHSSSESEWPLGSFAGLDTTKPGRQDVHFTIVRDAGTFDCEGYLNNGEGAGLFHFHPDSKYPREMQGLGFSGIDEDK